jgi:pimeloyl-ACP methyl ester carboxylesterase
LACACRLGAPLVSSLVLIAADGEYANPSIGFTIPEIYRGLTRQDMETRGDEISTVLCKQLLEQYESMTNEKRKAMAMADLKEAIRQGHHGVGNDRLLETQLWNFCVPTPVPFPVHIYHGADDDSVPPRVAEWFAKVIQPSHLHMLPKENHSLVRRHWETILSQFTSIEGTSPSSSLL